MSEDLYEVGMPVVGLNRYGDVVEGVYHGATEQTYVCRGHLVSTPVHHIVDDTGLGRMVFPDTVVALTDLERMPRA